MRRFFPSVTGAAFYDDNVFAANRNKQGSMGYIVRPEIGFQFNNTGNATVNGGAYVEQRWYDRFSSEDQTNAGAVIGGTNNIDKDTQLVGRAQYIHAHEDRGSVESQFQQFQSPITYDQFDAAGALNKRFGRWWTSIGAAATWLNYSDATLNGLTIFQELSQWRYRARAGASRLCRRAADQRFRGRLLQHARFRRWSL